MDGKQSHIAVKNVETFHKKRPKNTNRFGRNFWSRARLTNQRPSHGNANQHRAVNNKNNEYRPVVQTDSKLAIYKCLKVLDRLVTTEMDNG